MSRATNIEDNAKITGQARFFQLLHASLSSAALRCAVKLNIAGIINTHDGPITLSQIALGIGSPSVNIDGLSRLMRFLVHKQIFDEVHHQAEHEEPLYSLNECSKFLVQDTSDTLAPIVNCFTDPLMCASIYNLNQSIEEGGTAAFKTYGVEVFDFLSRNPEANKLFNESMACRTRMEIDSIMSTYDFRSLEGTLVDVGGGIGVTISKIVATYPHLKGINFDLPHVISSAPLYEGVTHVGGDMFTAIPHAESFLMKSTLHNWGDEKCVKVLRNCRESLTKRNGKVIIIDIILNPVGNHLFDEIRMNMDMIMLTSFDGGKERTEVEWKRILQDAGFPYYKIIKTHSILSIIEAYMGWSDDANGSEQFV